MRETDSQALRRRPSQVLELAKDVISINSELFSQLPGTHSEREGRLCLSTVLRRELSEFLLEAVEARGEFEPPAA